MTNSSKTTTTLVLGGTGKTGRRVAERLMARGVAVRLGSRSATPRFDWDEPGTWAPALDDVGAVYVAYHPDLAFAGAAERIGAFAELAVSNAVSPAGPAVRPGRGRRLAAERAYSVGGRMDDGAVELLRPELQRVVLLEPLLGGELAFPAGTSRNRSSTPTTSPMSPPRRSSKTGHGGQVYEVTGPGCSPSARPPGRDRRRDRPRHLLRTGPDRGVHWRARRCWRTGRHRGTC